MLTLNDGRTELWQWDTGRKLTVDADCSQVHFSNKVFGRSIDVDVVDGTAAIPDVLLQVDNELIAWAFVGTPENGYTKISKVFKVNKRNKPADYVFTPPEQTTMGQIMKRLDDLEAMQDPDAIKNAVDDYLANNPIQIDEKDPTVPAWAKQPIKPKYTAKEVGAVATVNGKTPDENGNVEITIPDSGGNVDLTGYAKEQWVQQNYQPKGEYLTAVPDGYAKTEDIPTKPEDIGAQPSGNYALKTEIPSIPVQSVNGKTGAVKLSASDVGARHSNWMPTAQEVGALPDTYVPPNQTAAQVGADPAGTATAAVSTHNTSTDSHLDLRLELKAINDRLTAFFDSDNQTLDELSEIVAYITSNKALIDSITTSKVSVTDIINNLTTNVANKPLSAAQGVVLKGLIDAVSASLSGYQPKGDYALASAIPTKVSQLQNDKGYLTEHQDISGKLDANKLPEAVNAALAQAKKSGEFDGDPGAPGKDGTSVTVKSVSESTADGGSNVVEFSDGTTVVIKNGKKGADGKNPVKGVDYWTDADQQEIEAFIATELAKRGQLKPEFAESEEWLNANGDTTKMYVLDGMIWANMLTEVEGSIVPNFTNLMDDAGAYIKDGYRYSHSGGTFKEYPAGTSLVFPYKAQAGTHIFRVIGGTLSSYSNSSMYMGADGQTFASVMSTTTATDSNGIISITSSIGGDMDGYVTIVLEGVSDKDNIIVTMDEEITYTTTEGGMEYRWVNTGYAFVSAGYEDRIVALEEAVSQPRPSDYSGNILYGKKWVVCGDSYTSGGYTSADGFDESVYKYQSGKFAGKNIVYPHIIGLRNNMNVVNLATSGQTMANSSNSFMTRYANIDADADYITIMLGINDKGQNIPVGTVDDSTNATFCGAFNIAMEHILVNHPFAHVGIIVSNDTNAEYMEATRDIAERWGTPYLDFGNPQIPLMNGHTGRNVCAKATEIRWQNFCVSPTSNGHPNTAAHEYESTFIEAWLRTL